MGAKLTPTCNQIFSRREPPKNLVASAGRVGKYRFMLSRVFSAAVNGIDAYLVEVEVNCGFGDTFIAMLSCILRSFAVSLRHER